MQQLRSDFRTGEMIRTGNDEKMSQLKSEAIIMLNSILTDSMDVTQDITVKCVNLTKHLFSHQYLLYTNLNEYFASSGVLNILINMLPNIQNQSKRDLLRLMHVLIQTNQSLSEVARRSDQFQTFLKRYLDQSECWENRTKYKHHINIASALLIDRDTLSCSFNTASVRKLVRKMIDDLVSMNCQDYPDVLPSIIFYACSMSTTNFEDIPKEAENPNVSKNVLSKEIIGRCSDLLRDYIQDFKVFYTSEAEFDKPHHILYKPRAEFSFQQICSTIIYYSLQSEHLRMNIFQSGLYGMMNNFLSLKFVPESLLIYGTDILKLPSLDAPILKGVKSDYLKAFNDKLNILLKRDVLSEKIKVSIKDLLKIFETSESDSFEIPSGEIIRTAQIDGEPRLIPITDLDMDKPLLPNYFGFEKWGHLDVHEWFADHHLEELRERFPHMTGRGLKQLQFLLNKTSQIELIEFLMGKMKTSFEMTLELIGALETL